MNDYMKSVLKNIKGYTKIYSSSAEGFNQTTFRDKCKNHVHTICVARSNFGKILGGYSPMKWANFDYTKVTGGESFVFFYDEEKLRICSQKSGAEVYSTGVYLSVFGNFYNAFDVRNDKRSWAGINNSG